MFKTLIGGAVLAAGGEAWRRRLMTAGPGWHGPVSDHFDGERFFNPDGPGLHTTGEFWKWQFTKERAEWPESVTDGFAEPALPPRMAAGELAVTFVGHATFLLQAKGLTVLTDPVFSERASPVSWAGPKRVRRPGVAFEALPPVDVVLLSHNHYDHLDLATLERLRVFCDPLIVTGLGNKAFLAGKGFAKVVELDWWQQTALGPGSATVHFVPAHHWSNRGAGGPNTTLWGGFVLEVGGRKVYCAGDTGPGSVFSAVRAKFGALDVALLPIGAYEPEWFMRPVHMTPADAVEAHGTLGARLTLGMHFGTFQLTDEALGAPEAALAAARVASGVAESACRAPLFGETVLV